MAGPPASIAAGAMEHHPGTRYGPALTLLASLFFMWGFITVKRMADAQSVILPYGLVALVLLILAIIIARFPLPAIGASVTRLAQEKRRQLSLWSHRNLVFGIPAIFIYVMAENGVASLFVNFISQPQIASLTHEQAGRYLTFLWGGMMIGRFAGSAIMQRVDARKVLAVFAAAAFVVMTVTVFAQGPVAMWSLILVGLCHSIMFPTRPMRCPISPSFETHVESRGLFRSQRIGRARRFAGDCFDQRGDRCLQPAEAGSGPIQRGIEVEAAIHLDLQGVKIIRGPAMAFYHMVAGIGMILRRA